ncbi:MAG: folate-binding protein YgfZ [Pseudomonadales bacterium]|nr:folate-binding protein YgfZ [Pseudomonadales bacterium]
MTHVIQIPDTGFVAVTGKDALKFLQGYTTCDLNDLTPSLAGLGATCNLQGRMLANYRIVRIEDGYLLRMHARLTEPFISFLSKYIVFSKAKLEDCSDRYKAWGVIDDQEQPPAPAGSCEALDDGWRIRISDKPNFEIWSEKDLTVTGTDLQWQALEVAEGILWVNNETTETYIPQMFNLHGLGGIAFDKGCYLGQEIVARMQYRGELSRKLYRGSGADLQTGDELSTPEGKAIGQVLAIAGGQFLAVLQSKTELSEVTTPGGKSVAVSLAQTA